MATKKVLAPTVEPEASAPDAEWQAPVFARKGSARTTATVRAKIAHTNGPSRRLEIYITQPVTESLGWTQGGVVAPAFQGSQLRLLPSHRGLRATQARAKSKTLRVVVSGAPLVKAMCAKVRDVQYRAEAGALFVTLPPEWFAASKLEAF